jgi:hypothetical protein
MVVDNQLIWAVLVDRCNEVNDYGFADAVVVSHSSLNVLNLLPVLRFCLFLIEKPSNLLLLNNFSQCPVTIAILDDQTI